MNIAVPHLRFNKGNLFKNMIDFKLKYIIGSKVNFSVLFLV